MNFYNNNYIISIFKKFHFQDFTNVNDIIVCATCKSALNKHKIPIMSTFNGFKYHPIPFMTIRRLRHVHGKYGIYGQVINVPVTINNMVNRLPRNIEEDHSVYAHIKKKKIHSRVLFKV